jgi:replication factor A1
MQLPLNEIIDRIKESTTLTQEDIEEKIRKKTDQLSGLISKEGAAQIIANELGVKLYKLEGAVKIDKIVGGMKTIETVGKITRKFDINTFNTADGKQGKVGSLVIADDTGSIRVTFWHDMTDKLSLVKEGDIVKVADAYVKLNNNKAEIHMNERSRFHINPEGETIGAVKEYTSRRKQIKDLMENDENVEVLATIVQAYEPRFFEICPDCNRRVKLVDGKYICNNHNSVIPNFSYVMNVHLDDGSGNVRAVCFKNQAKALLGKEDSQMLIYKDNPAMFEDIKQELLGTFVRMIGRVTKNSMFDRLEFVSQLVFPNPSAKEELNK